MRTRSFISPTVVGAVTTLIVVVAVYLAYNANQGLPFVSVYRVGVEVPNAARMVAGNEVRIGGSRVGVVESIDLVEADDGPGATDSSPLQTPSTVARLNLKLDRTADPLPQASAFRVRYRSSFGLKYLEIIRGGGPPAPEGFTFSGTDDGPTCTLPTDPEAEWEQLPVSARNGCFQEQTEFDDINNTFNAQTRVAGRANLVGYGSAFATRGPSLNEAINTLEPLFRGLKPVARVLAEEETQLGRFFAELGDAARIVAPVAAEQAEFFGRAATAFAAISDDPDALRETITEGVPTLESGIALLPAQQEFLSRFAVLSREQRPGVEDLRFTLPTLNEALVVGTPVLERSPEVNEKLRRALGALERLVEQESTPVTLERLGETFEIAEPLAEHVAPAQTVCNYWNYFFTFLPNAISDRDQIGHTFRQIAPRFPTGPAQAEAPVGGYTGRPANGRTGLIGGGEFRPYEIPIQNTDPYAMTGQRNADCQVGQTGYPLGQLRTAGQSASDPTIKVSDLPGSRGPTTLFYNADGDRELIDSRVPSRQPGTWKGLKP